MSNYFLRFLWGGLILSSVSFAAEFELKSGTLAATVSTQGGSLAQFSGSGKQMVYNATGQQLSFTDRVLRQDGTSQLVEDFGTLQFKLLELTAQKAVFSAVGTNVFDWLRITKTYVLDSARSQLKIQWQLENISSKPGQAGFWIRTFLRRHGEAGLKNSLFIPRNGKIEKFIHPGNVSGDIWTMKPDLAVLGFADSSSGDGAVILLPPDLTTTFYQWCSGSNFNSTQEWFFKEQTVTPGTPVKFEVVVRLSAQVEREMRSPELQARPIRTNLKSTPLLAKKYGLKTPHISEVYNAPGRFPISHKYMDVSGRRQYNPSVRSVLLPGNFKPDQISIYELANNAPENDRPVAFQVEKLASGQQRLMFYVPGFNYKGYYYSTFKGSLVWYYQDWNSFIGKFLGDSNFNYRICLDRPATRRVTGDFRDGVNVIWNGDLERQAAYGNWPDGYFWSWGVNRNRKVYSWTKASPDGSHCMLITEPKNRRWDRFMFSFRPEPGRKYTVECLAKSDNAQRDYSIIGVAFENAQRKTIKNEQLYAGRQSFGWRNFKKVIYAPQDAAFANLVIMTYPGQKIWVDKVKIVPEDFSFVPRSRADELRNELKSRYTYLDYIEKLSHQVKTPHTPWLVDARDPMPEVLYLPNGFTKLIQGVERREIFELAQRLKFNFRYLPLLRKMDARRGWHGWHPAIGNALEEYTIYQLDQIKKCPPVVIVQAIDFQKMVQKKFVEQLKNFQKQGANFLFYNCRQIPAELLGQKIAIPEGILALPQFRAITPQAQERAISVYRQGRTLSICFNPGAGRICRDNWGCIPQYFPRYAMPQYYGSEFPFWEYIQLAAVKILRELGEVKPQLRVLANRPGGIEVQAQKAVKARLKLICRDLNHDVEQEKIEVVQFQPGRQVVPLNLADLPGGTHVVDYWLLDEKEQIYDCGALTFRTPETAPLKIAFAKPDKIFQRNEAIKFTVGIANLPAQSRLAYTIYDRHRRVVASGEQPAQSRQQLAISLLPPYSTLYRLKLKLISAQTVVSKGTEVFSVTSPGKDIYQLDGLTWQVPNAHLIRMGADLGFTMSITYFADNAQQAHAMRDVGMAPVPFGMGNINGSRQWQLRYRFDGVTKDTVRKPCYSNPQHWKICEEGVAREIRRQNYRFYDIQHFEIADEAYLGSTVCTSPFCLAGFRKELQKHYGTLERLNQEWESNFPSWEQVTPKQLTELQKRDNLAPWLDHKMFMSQVFARNWVGKFKESIQKFIPNAKVGLSGTDLPGYSYDWAQMMKYISCLSYYGGIQRKLVHDFAAPGFVSGYWGGGYIKPERVNEFYEKSAIWDDMMLGANMVSNYMTGFSFRGDLSPVENTLFYAELLQELRRGPARLLLHAPEIRRDVAILYSQPSLFVAMAGIGKYLWHNSQTGWNALLNDLQYSFKWITYEELERGIPAVKTIILPVSLALSAKQVANLQHFVAQGGTVIADVAPGLCNAHGRKLQNSAAEKLFGISRAAAKFTPGNAQVRLNAAFAKSPCPLLLGESKLTLKGATAHGRTMKNDPVILINKLGKGQTVLLNFLVSDYLQVDLSGVGGEVANIKTGAENLRAPLRRIVRQVLKSSTARPNSEIGDARTGAPCQYGASLRRDGVNYVYLLHQSAIAAPDGKYPMRFAPKFNQHLKVKLPVKGHLYEVRHGQYLGCTNKFEVKLNPGDGRIYTVLADRVRQVAVQVPPQIKRGQELTVKFQAVGGSGSQVFHLEMLNPQGQKVPAYAQNVHCDQPSGQIKFQTAFNDVPGTWQVVVKNVNTGLTYQTAVNFQ